MPRPDRAEESRISRDRRIFASIQGTLNRGKTSLNQNSHPHREEKITDTVEELDDLDSIISQIMDLNIRRDRSALEIKRSISECAFLARMTENEWKTVCKSLINTALTDGETNFVVDLFIPLMEYHIFCEILCTELMTLCASFVMDGPNGIGNIPALLSAILCANWPRHLSKAIDTINPILYTSVFIIKGWLLVLQEDNEAVRKAENSSSFQDQKKGDSSSTAQKREDPEVVNRCAHTLCLLCESAQRSLWMKWPELCNEIYSIIKPSITHNHAITGDVKASLLHIMMLMGAWTKTKAVTMKNVQTQTIRSYSP